jgi:diguanylate cyclase (GGDEF)-like protein/PAS domain S-box-containing protein
MENTGLSKYAKIQEQIALEKTYFQQLFDNSPQGIVILEQNFNIIMANEGFCKLFKYEMSEIIGKNIDDLIAPKELYKEAVEITKNASNGEFIKKEVVRKTKNNILKHFSVLAYPIIRENLQIGIYAIYDDITKKKQHEEKLKLFASVLENNTEGVIITDKNGKITWINQAFSTITGYNLEEIEGKNPSLLQSGIHTKTFYKNMWNNIINKGYWKGEIWNKNKYNKIYPQKINIFSIGNENNISNIVGIITDITKEKEKEEKIYELAYRDSLTGLYNRESFNKILTESIKKANKNQSKMALLFLDLNGFKKINDNLGHSMGDNLLKVIANNLNLILGEKIIIARIGGDEFTVLIDNYTHMNEIVTVIKKIKRSFVSPWIFDNYKFYLSTSIGISLYPDHGIDSDTLICKADLAMYKAKESGSSSQYIFYSPSMSEKTQEEFLIENNLRNALRQKEFTIHYQPIIDIKTNSIIGAEALLRWNNKSNLGIVCPKKFIPIAEKCGLIIPIGEWILREACIQNAKWIKLGLPPLFISVNVSIKQLQQRDFLNMLSNILKEVEMDAEYLVLDITENFFMKDIKNMLPHLDGLNSLGVRISIDDFGTGFSCLSKLANLEIDALKIDQSFINNIDDPNNITIISAIISLAKCLNLKVVAEGVDTDSQLKFLKEYNCDMMQGHLYSPPVPSQIFEKLLKQNLK